MRLDKFLSSAMGLGSRTDVKKFIKNGRVEVIGTDNPRPEPVSYTHLTLPTIA